MNTNVLLLDLPETISAYTVANKNTSFTIVINSRLSNHQQQTAYSHELNHIQHGDYDKKCSADLIEFYAHM